MIKLPRNVQLWGPGYVRSRIRQTMSPAPKRVWVAVTDHFEPLWGRASEATAVRRVMAWRNRLTEIADRTRDSDGNPLKYSFFYAQEEYQPELLEPLAELVRAGCGDVEVHIHHNGEGRENFTDRMQAFLHVLHSRHGLLRKMDRKVVFGFIHGNWALGNSLPNGQWCGLNDEITLLRDLGCYADFTMPSGNSASQARLVNAIYWCVDDPRRPKSYDSGPEVTPGGKVLGDLMMITGPIGIRWRERLLPRLENGELCSTDRPTRYRVQRWFDFAPRIGTNLFIKLFTHGCQERNSDLLLGGDLEGAYKMIADEAARRNCSVNFVSAWEMYQVVEGVRLCTLPDSPKQPSPRSGTK
jgi:hypothetical protein